MRAAAWHTRLGSTTISGEKLDLSRLRSDIAQWHSCVNYCRVFTELVKSARVLNHCALMLVHGCFSEGCLPRKHCELSPLSGCKTSTPAPWRVLPNFPAAMQHDCLHGAKFWKFCSWLKLENIHCTHWDCVLAHGGNMKMHDNVQALREEPWPSPSVRAWW